MKKIVVLISTILIFLQFGSISLYAECDVENLRLRDIDFSEIIDGEKIAKQTVGDKMVTIMRFEDFSEQNYVLEKKCS